MKRNILLTCCILLMLSSGGCHEELPGMSGVIYGTVSDADDSNAPLKGVTVTLDQGRGNHVTEEDGLYEFTNLDATATYSLTFSKDGYQTDYKNSVKVDANGRTAVNMQLHLKK
jgi:hypothetical protein